MARALLDLRSACEPGVMPEQREQSACACAARSLDGVGAWVPPLCPPTLALCAGGGSAYLPSQPASRAQALWQE